MVLVHGFGGNADHWRKNVPVLAKGRDRCTLIVHPEDASRCGVEAGGKARVRSRVGEVVAPVEVSEDIRPGVVSLPHGFGHRRHGVSLRVAAAQPGVSANDLTDEQSYDPLSGNACLTGTAVEVTAAG